MSARNDQTFSSHAQWMAEDEGGTQEYLSSLSELPSKRSLALHELQNGGEVWLPSSPTALQHDPSKFCSHRHLT